MDKDNPLDGYERLFKEEYMEELRDWLRGLCEIKKVKRTEEEIEKALKAFTKIYVDDDDDIVWIDSEESLFFN